MSEPSSELTERRGDVAGALCSSATAVVPLADIPRTEEMPSIGVGVAVLVNGWLPRPSSSKKPLAPKE